ncbi:MAG: hypothetical protein ACRCSO_04005 [Sphingomonas sp.]
MDALNDQRKREKTNAFGDLVAYRRAAANHSVVGALHASFVSIAPPARPGGTALQSDQSARLSSAGRHFATQIEIVHILNCQPGASYRIAST